jgi:hypothetical protein
MDSRLKEHQQHISLDHPGKSAAAVHSINLGHRFQLHHTAILSTKSRYMGSLHHMTIYVGSPRGHADPCALPLSEHNVCSLWALTNFHPDVPASVRCLRSLITHRMPAAHFLDISPLRIASLPNTPLQFFCLLHRPDIFMAILNSSFSQGGRVTAKLFHSVSWPRQ